MAEVKMKMRLMAGAALLLAACGAPGLDVSSPDVPTTDDGFLKAVTLSYWLRSDDVRHRALCVLAEASQSVDQTFTLDINTAGMFDTAALLVLCKQVPEPANGDRR